MHSKNLKFNTLCSLNFPHFVLFSPPSLGQEDEELVKKIMEDRSRKISRLEEDSSTPTPSLIFSVEDQLKAKSQQTKPKILVKTKKSKRVESNTKSKRQKCEPKTANNCQTEPLEKSQPTSTNPTSLGLLDYTDSD